MNKYFAQTIIAAVTISMIATLFQQYSIVASTVLKVEPTKNIPIAISGNNVYMIWSTNETGNDEVMFRASNNDGSIFADKINLSNTTSTDSQDPEISADGDTVVVTWWERNATSELPAARISSDNGQTFGSPLKLATNGTIGSE
jgi:hypothetical protein